MGKMPNRYREEVNKALSFLTPFWHPYCGIIGSTWRVPNVITGGTCKMKKMVGFIGLAFLHLIVACSSMAPTETRQPTAVTDFKSVAGKWEGLLIRDHPFTQNYDRVTLVIDETGAYDIAVMRTRTTAQGVSVSYSVIGVFAEKGKSFTSGRAGGLICEPLKAVWPAYAGIFTRISSAVRASYLLSLAPLCTLGSALHPAPPLTRNIPSPKSSAPQSSSRDP